jgi:2-haloacid dehalogenase
VAIDIKPKFVSFDMNGTLIHYRQDETIRKVLADRLPAGIVDDFELAGEQIRFDECMGDWRPMHEVIEAALRRTMARFGVEYREGDARAVYDQIPTWTPYAGVTEALRRLAEAYPLVILTNSDDVHAPSLVENLQAPVEIVHVSSSPQYDHRPAFDVGITNKVYLDRGWEPDQPWLSYTRITDIANFEPHPQEYYVLTADLALGGN